MTATMQQRLTGKSKKTCLVCHKTYIGKAIQKYCNIKCRRLQDKRADAIRRGKIHDGDVDGFTHKKCRQCGSNYKTKRPDHSMYCTRLCKEQQSVKRGDNVKCEYCNERITQTSRYKYCSDGCYRANQWRSRVTHSGNHPQDFNTSLDYNDLVCIQTLWDAFEFSGLASFDDNDSIADIYDKSLNRPPIHQWVIYTILIQGHIKYKYDNFVRIPNLNKRQLLGICKRFNVVFVDSPMFESDMTNWKTSTKGVTQ